MLRFRFRSNLPEDEYPKQLASWQIDHGTDRHDLTPDQDRRLRQHNLMLNAGLDVDRIAAVRWAVEHGRIGEDDQPTEEMIERAIRIPLERVLR